MAFTMTRTGQTTSLRRRWLRPVCLTLVLACIAACVTAPLPVVGRAPPLRLVPGDASVLYWHETRSVPRPLQLHVLRIDLQARPYEVVAAVADDPDGPGPAQAKLEEPVALATRKGLVAAVNANAFSSLPDANGKRDTNWFLGKPVTICGYAAEDGVERSPPQAGYVSVWIDGAGAGHSGMLQQSVAARQAVGGFSVILADGVVTDSSAGNGAPLHPRTAAGVDATGRWLWIVEVDGRQSGYSEGMNTGELGVLMKELGCWNAANLDGGGSSVMLFSPAGGAGLKIMNRPSGGATRPVPVLLGIRARMPAGAGVGQGAAR